MISLELGKELLGMKVPNGVIVPKVETWIVNIDLHHCQVHGLTLVPTKKGGLMWVHPDPVKEEQ